MIFLFRFREKTKQPGSDISRLFFLFHLVVFEMLFPEWQRF